MDADPDILVVGALHLDVVVDAPHLPAPDETVVGHSVAYRFGGKGGNQAVAAARMGARVAMAGQVGADRFGAQIIATLDAAGVNRTGVGVSDGASGMSVAIVNTAGDYGAVIVSGVNRIINGAAVRVPNDLKLLLLQNEIPETVNLAVAAQAGPETRIILNAAPARKVPAELLSRVDVLIANRGEATAMAHSSDPAEAAERLLGTGSRAVVVTLGSEGLVAATRAGERVTLPAPAVSVVSSHGAGDAFTGALAAEMARGAQMLDALSYAQAAAALVVATQPDHRGTLSDDLVRTFHAGL